MLIISILFARHFSAQDHVHTAEKDSSITPMSHAFSLNLPMNRNGSGTAWLPDASAMYGYGFHTSKWMFMFHNNIFIRYNKQDLTNKGSRGAEKFDVPSWFMFMGQRKISKRGLFRFNTMLSADPFTVGGEGYPLLFQSGENYKNKRLVDRQHPHDLFSELSVAYTHMFSKETDVTAYLAYPGEPALGPVAFMHRVSALNNPDAPLSHHWQDATHINYGVATIGIRYSVFKFELSSFTGREPDENRYDFDRPRFDSYSGRLSCAPTNFVTVQVSQAFLKSPEVNEPTQNVIRSTASVIHHLPLYGSEKYLSSSAVWGFNDGHQVEHSLLLESTLQYDRISIYGRYEFVQKSASELDLLQFQNGEDALFNIDALTLGVNYVILKKFKFNTAVGAQASVFDSDSRLSRIYGQNPLSAEVYVRFYPQAMRMTSFRQKKQL